MKSLYIVMCHTSHYVRDGYCPVNSLSIFYEYHNAVEAAKDYRLKNPTAVTYIVKIGDIIKKHDINEAISDPRFDPNDPGHGFHEDEIKRIMEKNVV